MSKDTMSHQTAPAPAPARTRFGLPPRNDEGSLLLAILVAVVVTALIAAATIAAIAAQNKTRSSQKFAMGQALADAAVSDALMTFNLATNADTLAPQVDQAHPRTGTVGDMRWTWYATPAASAEVGDAYTVNITTQAKSGTGSTRDFVVTIAAVRTQQNGASVAVNGETTYNIDAASGFGLGFFADDEFILNGTSKVTSYDSGAAAAAPAAGTGHGRIGTNGTITTGTGSVDEYALWNYASMPFADRCTGQACAAATSSTQEPRIGLGGYCATGLNPDPAVTPGTAGYCGAATKVIDKACQGKTLTPYRASTSGAIPAGVSCWSSLLFDTTPAISGIPGNPSKVYVTGGQGNDANGLAKGTISVLPGVNVNMAQAGPGGPRAFRLLIYSKGTHVTLDASTGAVNAAWGLWAPNADCGGNSTSGAVTIYGSMTCDRITANDNWSLRWDEQAQYVRDTSIPGRAWYMESFQEK